MPTSDQRANARRITKHLVKRKRHEVRATLTQIESVRRHERRRVKQHIPPVLFSGVDPGQVVLHTTEVRLRRQREQLGPVGRLREQLAKQMRVEAEIRRFDGCVYHVSAATTSELAN